jgi:enoyl-CoA hydratase
MLLTARAYTAQEAKDIGLIGHVVPDGQALSKAKELAGLIAANGPLAVEAILKSVQETATLTEEEALKLEFAIGWPIFSTEDSKEGPRAFAEKRQPVWKRR